MVNSCLTICKLLRIQNQGSKLTIGSVWASDQAGKIHLGFLEEPEAVDSFGVDEADSCCSHSKMHLYHLMKLNKPPQTCKQPNSRRRHASLDGMGLANMCTSLMTVELATSARLLPGHHKSGLGSKEIDCLELLDAGRVLAYAPERRPEPTVMSRLQMRKSPGESLGMPILAQEY